MVKVEEKPEIFDTTDLSRTVEETVRLMVEEMGYNPNTARREVLLSRKAKKGPISDYVFTLPDGTEAVRII
jgi:hypothetical protein